MTQRRPLESRHDRRSPSKFVATGMATLNNFDNYPTTPNRVGDYENRVTIPALTNTMTLSVLAYFEAVPTVYNGQTICQMGTSALGWMGITAFGGIVRARVNTSSGTYTATYVVGAGDVGKYVLLTSTFDGANINLYRQGVLQTSTPTAGTVIANTTGMCCGGQYGGDGCYEIGVVGWAFSNTTVIASPSTHYNQCVTAGDFTSFTGADYAWKASSMRFVQSSWPPIVGSTSLSINGTNEITYSKTPLVMA